MTRTVPLIVALFLMASLLLAGALHAESSYDLSWWTVDGGGGTSTSASYTLTGTIGQADAGLLSGGAFTLSGGFWWAEGAPEQRLYLPLVLRG